VKRRPIRLAGSRPPANAGDAIIHVLVQSMRFGLHLTRYVSRATMPRLPVILRDLAARAEEAGLHSLWPMDQLEPRFAAADDPMLEAYTTLGWVAAATERLQLGALVTPPDLRDARLLARTVQTLDLLSGGRAWLGLGAGNAADRYQRLERSLVAIRAAWDELTAPRADPHRRVPILIAGGGPRRTLPLVARHADACNLLEREGHEALRDKLDVLRRECEEAGRSYDALVKTTFGRLTGAEHAGAAARFDSLAVLGIDLALVDLPDLTDPAPFALLRDLVRRYEAAPDNAPAA
jgi:alkanesulfonate monooxygenase SsuD/methylene tetrahydromethanopterin reductase-like flavin-dependent oxidoreductase (luciferase family)